MSEYIKPDRSGWTHEQLENELEGALKLYRIAMKQYKNDLSTITQQAEVIRELKEDAECWYRQQSHPCLDFMTCCEMESRHTALMNRLEGKDA